MDYETWNAKVYKIHGDGPSKALMDLWEKNSLEVENHQESEDAYYYTLIIPKGATEVFITLNQNHFNLEVV